MSVSADVSCKNVTCCVSEVDGIPPVECAGYFYGASVGESADNGGGHIRRTADVQNPAPRANGTRGGENGRIVLHAEKVRDAYNKVFGYRVNVVGYPPRVLLVVVVGKLKVNRGSLRTF